MTLQVRFAINWTVGKTKSARKVKRGFVYPIIYSRYTRFGGLER